MLHAVIMAGGSGVRFWPQSRRNRPKQFLPLVGARTLLQETVGRVDGWIPPTQIWIVTNRALLPETMDQVPQISRDRLLAEPCARNTAPCIGLAAVAALHADPDALMLVMPADHVIEQKDAFEKAVQAAVSIVKLAPDALVLFGIRPDRAATGFGYIERGDPLGSGVFRVAAFKEKPDRATAEKYLASGHYHWNSGIFVWRAQAILDALAEFEPKIAAGLALLQQAAGTPDWDRVLDQEFPNMPSISIDYAVLEHARDVRMLEAPFDWDDVGSWQALAWHLDCDADGNAVSGPFCGHETRGCIVRTTDDHLVATLGLEDCIVVHTPDATLVARKGDEEAIRALVEKLREQGYARFL